MEKNIQIAVLMTCFNRKEQTLSCLDLLFLQENIETVQLHVFLVDDGCTDGTGDAVQERYPNITLLQGDGTLFWNGGMRLAFEVALQKGFDYYLWLNEDSMLYPNAINILLDTVQLLHQQTNKHCIIVGSMQDSQTGEFTYGGRLKRSASKFKSPWPFKKIIPSDMPQQCDVVNGNCVLIPNAVVELVGNLSPYFTHGIGDYDYSLRAKKLKILSWVAPGYVGTCDLNTLAGSCRDDSISLQNRVKRLQRTTALPSAKEWMIFTKRHGGWLWPIYWLRTAVRTCIPHLWVLLRAQNLK